MRAQKTRRPSRPARHHEALRLHADATRQRAQLMLEAGALRRAGKIREARIAEKCAKFLGEHIRALEERLSHPA
ncbi:MAG TPA: hypothetical protein VNU73_09615 [Steroidobacteraceae bacterium]|jgi:hypothetical protein|nr:hypothetical protein [Steroidobacteraceae bacterium]